MSPSPVLEVEGLHKTFKIGFFRKKVHAVCGIDFRVMPGQIFGLLGPNGAGKTTTIKMILRLIFPSQGNIKLFGDGSGDMRAMARVGYMPENPYVYRYLKPMEFLDLCGRLSGVPGAERRKRASEMIERVGLGHAADRPIGKFSKGMTQRIGLAQALLHDPELLILDEPMSGLDPIGRKEVRDLLLEQRRAGKTLIFTSHILADVEHLCDHVVIMRSGKISARGALHELLHDRDHRTEIEVEAGSSDDLDALGLTAKASAKGQGRYTVSSAHSDVQDVLMLLLKSDIKVVAVNPRRQRLEQLFVDQASTVQKEN